jgi:acyl-CoA thioester hydrolase
MLKDSLANPKNFRFWTDVSLRYGDTDSLGHINNAVYTVLFEAGRAALLFDRHGAIAGQGKTFVIVHLSVNFVAEMHYPGVARVGTALASFGRTSLKLVQGVFKDDICTATAESAIVLIDEETRKPIQISEELKQQIEKASRLQGQSV